MATVGLLHPGAMGATLARGIAGAEVLWCPDGRSGATLLDEALAHLRA